MVDYNDPKVNAHMVSIAVAISLISVGFFLYDLILAVPFDWSIILGKRQRRWPQIAYFAAKICYFAYIADMLLINYTIKEIDCQAAIEMLEMLMGFVVLSSSALLACRTVCVFYGTGRTIVAAILVLLWLGMAAAWMQGVTDATMIWSPANAQLWTDGACYPTAVKTSYFAKYVVTILFDAVVLGLTTFGIARMSGSSRIGQVLITQGFISFLLTFVANLVITVLTALQLSAVMSLLFAVPQSTICTICACRLYVELANESKVSHQSSHQNASTHSGGSGFLGKGYGYVRRPSGFVSSTTSPASDEKEARLAVSHPGKPGLTFVDDIEKQQACSTSSQEGQPTFVGNASLSPNAGRRSNGGVYIEQERTTHVDGIPPYMREAHPFSNLHPATDDEESQQD